MLHNAALTLRRASILYLSLFLCLFSTLSSLWVLELEDAGALSAFGKRARHWCGVGKGGLYGHLGRCQFRMRDTVISHRVVRRDPREKV